MASVRGFSSRLGGLPLNICWDFLLYSDISSGWVPWSWSYMEKPADWSNAAASTEKWFEVGIEKLLSPVSSCCNKFDGFFASFFSRSVLSFCEQLSFRAKRSCFSGLIQFLQDTVSIVMVSLWCVVFISLCSRFMISFNDFTSFCRVFSSAFSSIQHKQSFTLKSPLLEPFVEERLVWPVATVAILMPFEALLLLWPIQVILLKSMCHLDPLLLLSVYDSGSLSYYKLHGAGTSHSSSTYVSICYLFSFWQAQNL